jgi:O-antigen/teichoic acid export membrane protein
MTLAGGYGLQLAFQMVYFLILTRMLGPELFGRFAAALAAINLVSPLAGIGFGEVALVRVSQDPEKTGVWAATALAVTGTLGAMLAICLAVMSGVLASDRWLDWHLMLGLAISELVLVRCCLVIARVHQARRETLRTSTIYVAVAAVKALIALSLLMLDHKSLLALVLLLDLCLAPLLFAFFSSLRRRVPWSSISMTHLRRDARLAFSFAGGITCKAASADLDKLFLARWSSSYTVGTYAAGYKMLALSFMPIRAILEATFPRQLQLANRDPEQCIRFAGSLLVVNLAIASVISSGIYLLAPLVTYLLGEEFRDSIDILRLGFLLPVLQALHYTFGTYLTAIGHQSFRTLMQLLALGAYIVAGLILIPLYSWRGAIWTSLGCETLLVVLVAFGCLALARRGRNGGEPREEGT